MTAPLRVAVLGATGFLGGHVGTALAAEGDRVVGVARRPGPAPHVLHTLDVARAEPAEIAAFLTAERVDVVVNAIAGWGRTREEALDGNLRPTVRLLDALRVLPDGPRLVQIGTIHEYGPVAEGTSITEDTPAGPRSPYAEAKLASSERVLAAIAEGGVRGVVVRVANTFGPHPAPNGFVGALTARLRDVPPEGIDLTVADARRDYVDVRDAVRAVLAAIRTPDADPLVNVGSGEAVPVPTLVRALVRAAGLPPGAVREQAGEVDSLGGDWTRFDISRAGRLLGWRPRYTLEESVRAMWESVGEPRPVAS